MFSRVLSRPFFLKRGAQHDTIPNFTDETQQGQQETSRILQPTNENAKTEGVGAGPKKEQELSEKKHAGPRSNLNDENRLLAFRPFRDASKKGVHIVIPDEDQSVPDHVVNNLGPMKHDLSSSFILVNTLDNSAKPHDDGDEEDEDYKTPLLQAVDGPLIAYQPQVSNAESNERLPEKALPSPPLLQRSFVGDIASANTGLLSDITEADEPSHRDVSADTAEVSSGSPALLSEDGQLELSFSPFGSPYPSEINLDDVSITSPAASTRCACGRVRGDAEKVLVRVVPPNAPGDVSEEYQAFRCKPPLEGLPQLPANDAQLAPPEVAQVELVIVEDAGAQPVEAVTQAVVVSEQSDGWEKSSTSPHPVMTAESLAPKLALSPVHTNEVEQPHASSLAMEEPVPAATQDAAMVASPADDQVPALAHVRVAESPVEPLSSSLSTASVSTHRSGAPHSADRPNWALAPDEPPEPKLLSIRTARSRGRGKGRIDNRTRAPSSTRSADRRHDRGSRNSSSSKAAPTTVTLAQVAPSPVEPVTPPIEPTRAKSPSVICAGTDGKEPQESVDASSAPETVEQTDSRREEGPEQWLERVNSWIDHSTTTPQVPPSLSTVEQPVPTTIPSVPSTPPTTGRPRAASKSGLNPFAPVWEPRQRNGAQVTANAPVSNAPSNTASPTQREKSGQCLANDVDSSLANGLPTSHNYPTSSIYETPRRRLSGFLDASGRLHPSPEGSAPQILSDKFPRKRQSEASSYVLPPPITPTGFYKARGGAWVGGYQGVPTPSAPQPGGSTINSSPFSTPPRHFPPSGRYGDPRPSPPPAVPGSCKVHIVAGENGGAPSTPPRPPTFFAPNGEPARHIPPHLPPSRQGSL